MAYVGKRTKPTNKFCEWLNNQMCMNNMSAIAVAKELHCSSSAVYHHRDGRQRPTFSDVIAYCWLFKCKEEPETIWKMIDISSEE